MTSDVTLRALVNQEGNQRLSAQVALLCSSDARAAGLIAASAALAGVALTGALAAISLQFDAPLQGAFWGVFVATALASMAGAWCFWPEEVHLPGWAPGSFEEDWGKPTEEVLSEILSFVDEKVVANTFAVQVANARFGIAVLLLVLTPLAALSGSMIGSSGSAGDFGLVLGSVLLFGVLLRVIRVGRMKKPEASDDEEPTASAGNNDQG